MRERERKVSERAIGVTALQAANPSAVASCLEKGDIEVSKRASAAGFRHTPHGGCRQRQRSGDRKGFEPGTVFAEKGLHAVVGHRVTGRQRKPPQPRQRLPRKQHQGRVADASEPSARRRRQFMAKTNGYYARVDRTLISQLLPTTPTPPLFGQVAILKTIATSDR